MPTCPLPQTTLCAADRKILRALAARIREVAAEPVQQERIRLWKQHNSLRRPARPVLYLSPEGAWQELVPEASLECVSEKARGIEGELRRRLYAQEHFRDDVPLTAEWEVGRAIRNSGWGLEVKRVPSTAKRGSWHFEQSLHDENDLARITLPEIREDAEESQRRLEEARELFGDLLTVKQVGIKHISFHLMQQYTYWRGLEETLYDMYEEPELLHAVMARLTEGHLGVLRQYEEQNLLTRNNDGTYHNSGGFGWSDGFPGPGGDPAQVRLREMWGSAEAQEMSSVSPAQHKEFVLDYEVRLLEKFGLTGYGCCEDLTQKLDDVFTIPHIRRISLSPWADVDRCAPRLRGNYIFSWKPNPAMLVGEFRAEEIRQYIRHTIEVCAEHGCFLEIILKDTHTCENHPERFDTWAQIAREEIRRIYPD